MQRQGGREGRLTWLTLWGRRRPRPIGLAGAALWPCQAVAIVAAEADNGPFQVLQAVLVPIRRWGQPATGYHWDMGRAQA